MFLVSWAAYHNVSERALLQLVHMICIFIGLLGLSTNHIPTSLYSIRKMVGTNKDVFNKYCVCPVAQCRKIFKIDMDYLKERQFCTGAHSSSDAVDLLDSVKRQLHGRNGDRLQIWIPKL